MKKHVFIFVIVMFMTFWANNVLALSEEFLFVIDTVGIPRYNAYGDEISEDVYETYNVFSYSEPHKLTSVGQRWKNSKYGFWAKNKGRYNGSGTRGEYYILGYSYSGQEIYNYYFPMDSIPTTTPDKWTFYSYPEAKSSWIDTSKYKYEEQLSHMLNSKLMFNDISSRAKADNPKYIKEYDITAGEIGKEFARLDAAATWKTYGMISTRRKISGVIYKQVYLVKPMAADAEAICNLEVQDYNVLTEEQEELHIPITYGISVQNMTGYADKKHIKEIKAVLYINNEKVDEISGSKITSVGNEYMLVITRDIIPPNLEKSIEIKIDGYIHTEFAVDGLMQDTKRQSITIFVEPRKIIPVNNTNVMLLEKDVQKWVVRPLAQNIATEQYGSIGFVEAGRYIVVKLELNVESVENVRIYLDNLLLEHANIFKIKNKLVFKIKIPDDIETSLFGYASLREKEGSYFKTDISQIGDRRLTAHTLKIVVIYNTLEYETEILVDSLDNYLANINTSVQVTNYEQAITNISLEDWLNE